MKKKKATESLRSRIARAQGKKRAERRKAQAEKALRSFRPRKSERGSFVFIGPKGGRVKPNSKRKAVPVFISRTGKKRLVRERKKKGLSEIRFRAASAFNVGKVKGQTKAKKKFFGAKFRRQMESRTIHGDNIRWERFVAGAQADLKRVRGNRKTNATVRLAVEITVADEDDHLETHSFDFQWHARALQKLDDENFAAFFWSVVYAEFAQRLRIGRQVTVGSFSRVEKANRGKQPVPSKWQWKGKIWGKSSFEQVKVRRVKWELSKLKITSRG